MGAASEILIKLWLNNASFKLEYKDNGKGFDLNKLKTKKGLGMKNIESRLHMIQATYAYDSSPGTGFKLIVDLNYNQ